MFISHSWLLLWLSFCCSTFKHINLQSTWYFVVNSTARSWGISSIFGKRKSYGGSLSDGALSGTMHDSDHMPSIIQLRKVIASSTRNTDTIIWFVRHVLLIKKKTIYLRHVFSSLIISATTHLEAGRRTNRTRSGGNNGHQVTLGIILWHCQKEHSRLGSKSYNAPFGMLLH